MTDILCPDCNIVMDNYMGLTHQCDNCYKTISICKICGLENKDLNSDICGHPSCVEKKMSMMWKPEVERKTRREKNKHV